MFSWKMLLVTVVMLMILWIWDTGRYSPFVLGSSCPSKCMCRWKTGKQTVECTSRDLAAIPEGIDSDTQVLDLSGNNLQMLPKDTFLSANLLHLQRIYLSNCKIGRIDECAFSRLTNLVELDLSHNRLVTIPSVTFKDIFALRRLILSNNPIQRIDNNAFVSLNDSLTILELSRCQLESIAPKAFHGLKNLTTLRLDNNCLTTLSGKSIQPLKSVYSIDLHGNPWRCDCSLQEVKLWLTRCNIPYTEQPTCALPKRLHDVALHKVDMEDLACQPQSKYSNGWLEAVAGYNVSIVCEVAANPSPNMHWIRHGVVITNLSSFNQGRQVYVIYERGGTEKSSILTITRVTERDAGHYLCVAENRAGRFRINFTVAVTFRDLEPSGLTSVQIASISVGLILVGTIVSLLICILLAKWRQSERDEVKHPPLNHSQHKLMNSVNHVEHKGKSCVSSNHVRMSFSFPKLSRSNSAHRNYSDEASDSDRTLIDNSASPSKSSTCNLSTNKPDVVNVAQNPSDTSGRSKRDKDGHKKDKRQDKKQKEKRKERHRWKAGGGGAEDVKVTNVNEVMDSDVKSKQHLAATREPPPAEPVTDNRCNSLSDGDRLPTLPYNNVHHAPRSQQNKIDGELMGHKKALVGLTADEEDDGQHYGSYGNLKLSSSTEWNKITSEMIENAGFTRDSDVGGLARESYELLEKTWGRGNRLNADYTNAGESETSKLATKATIVIDDGVDGKTGGGGGANTSLLKNSTSAASRFRHYVPVLPPLPAQHYSQVRNSLIRTSKDEDITDM